MWLNSKFRQNLNLFTVLSLDIKLKLKIKVSRSHYGLRFFLHEPYQQTWLIDFDYQVINNCSLLVNFITC